MLIEGIMEHLTGVFDVAKWIIDQSGGIIAASTAIDASALAGMSKHKPACEAVSASQAVIQFNSFIPLPS